MRTASVLLAGALATFAHAKYILKDDYSAPNFLNMFNFDTVSSHSTSEAKHHH